MKQTFTLLLLLIAMHFCHAQLRNVPPFIGKQLSIVQNDTTTVGNNNIDVCDGIIIKPTFNECSAGTASFLLEAIPAGYASSYNWTPGYLVTPNFSVYLYTPFSASTYADIRGSGTVTLTYISSWGYTCTTMVGVYSPCTVNLAADLKSR